MDADRPSDDDIVRQRNALLDDEATQPLVGNYESIDVIAAEYVCNERFASKALDVGRKYAFFRRTRRDGNCFYRAYVHSLFETLLSFNSDVTRKVATTHLRDVCKACADFLINSMNFTSFIVEDFFDVLLEELDNVDAGSMNAQSLIALMCNEGRCDYIVVCLRYICTTHLVRHEEEFLPFMENTTSAIDWTSTQVQVMGHESDHLHIVSITQAIGLPIRVEYMDQSTGEEAVTHDFIPNTVEPSWPVDLRIYLLYRPGHYDILYVR